MNVRRGLIIAGPPILIGALLAVSIVVRRDPASDVKTPSSGQGVQTQTRKSAKTPNEMAEEGAAVGEGDLPTFHSGKVSGSGVGAGRSARERKLERELKNADLASPLLRLDKVFSKHPDADSSERHKLGWRIEAFVPQALRDPSLSRHPPQDTYADRIRSFLKDVALDDQADYSDWASSLKH